LRAPQLAIGLLAAADIQEHQVYKSGDTQGSTTVLEVSPAGISFILRLRVGIF
jgi:hypothetical protein